MTSTPLFYPRHLSKLAIRVPMIGWKGSSMKPLYAWVHWASLLVPPDSATFSRLSERSRMRNLMCGTSTSVTSPTCSRKECGSTSEIPACDDEVCCAGTTSVCRTVRFAHSRALKCQVDVVDGSASSYTDARCLRLTFITCSTVLWRFICFAAAQISPTWFLRYKISSVEKQCRNLTRS